MSISGISSNTTAASNFQNWQAVSRQRKQDVQDLAKSLESGDLSGAQKAYTDLTALAPSTVSSSGQPASTAVTAIQKDYAALGQALTSGNLAQAQQDFSQMKTDMKTAQSQNAAMPGVHHHHHHHPAAASQPQDGSASATSSTTALDSVTSTATNAMTSAFAASNPSNLNATALSMLG